MLGSRLEDEPSAAARTSYAIRSQTSENDWLHVNSTNIDGFVKARFPTLKIQRLNLLRWFAEKVGDDRLGTVRLPPADQLAAVVGAVNGERVEELVRVLHKDGHIEGADDGGMRLTSSGWDTVDMSDERAVASAEPALVAEKPTIELSTCPQCGPRRRAEVVAHHSQRNEADDSAVYSIVNHKVLRCCGCSTTFVRRDAYFSEDEDHEQDGLTGEWQTVLHPTTTYWPSRNKRVKPIWTSEIQDDVIHRLLDEGYSALNSELMTLATMGVRALLDKAFELAGADPGAGFEEKLRFLLSTGIIGAQEHEILTVMTDAGSAAVHRGWKPDPEALDLIWDATEAILHRVAVMAPDASKLRATVPPRPRRRKKPSP